MDEKDKALAKFDRLAKQRKMINLNVIETSGVDHPATGVEGWIVAKASSNPLDNPRSKESIKARQQAAAERIKARQQAARARQAGAKTVADPTKEFEDAVKALMESKKLTRAQAVAQLADKKPELVTKAETARQAKLNSDRAAAVTKAGEPESAQAKILAEANRLFVEGRAKSVPAGVELAVKLHPDLAEQAMQE